MDEMKLIELQLTGVRDSAARSRVAFFVMLFACGTILVTLYNTYFPWNRINTRINGAVDTWPQPRNTEGRIQDPAPPANISADGLKKWKQSLEDEKREGRADATNLRKQGDLQYETELAESGAISVDLLGIKLSSADLDIFGSGGLFLIAMYYLLCVRRTTLETAAVFFEAADKDPAVRKYIYSGVSQSYVLNSATEGDIPADSLVSPAPSSRRPASSGLAARLARWLFPRLTFLPVITMVTMLVSDWYFAIVLNIEYYGGGPAWLWRHMAFEFRAQFIVMQIVAWTLLFAIYLMNRNTYEFQDEGTGYVKTLRVALLSPRSDNSKTASASV